MFLSLSGTSREKLPSISVTTPIDVPGILTVAPINGSLSSAERTRPFTFYSELSTYKPNKQAKNQKKHT